MFIHSIRVPQNYKKSAKILRKVKEQGVSLKNEIYNRPHGNIKKAYALVVETLKHYSEIDTLIEKTKLLEKENRLDPWLARILLTELLWRKGELKGESKPIQTILSYRKDLEKYQCNIIPKVETKEVNKPRFVRINTLKLTLQEAVDGFREENWKLVRPKTDSYSDFIKLASSLNFDEFMVDMHIKELLLFPPKTQFFKHRAYLNKSILLQDKSSCLPVVLLNPPSNSIVLDMCAAPGMKTTFLAAKINNQGMVYAVERDDVRFKTLNNNVADVGATCIKTMNRDALKVTADDCPDVEYILVDPSCTGSGMTERITGHKEDRPSATRLKKLSGIQIILLKHALTHFPKAKRVVYSTCSIYREENEYVVEEVLKCASNFNLVSAKTLLNRDDVKAQEEESIYDKCFNLNVNNDLTNGFFVAVFERKVPDIETKNEQKISDGKKLIKKRKNETNIDFLKLSNNENIEVKPYRNKNGKRQVNLNLENIEIASKKVKIEYVKNNEKVANIKKKEKEKTASSNSVETLQKVQKKKKRKDKKESKK